MNSLQFFQSEHQHSITNHIRGLETFSEKMQNKVKMYIEKRNQMILIIFCLLIMQIKLKFSQSFLLTYLKLATWHNNKRAIKKYKNDVLEQLMKSQVDDKNVNFLEAQLRIINYIQTSPFSQKISNYYNQNNNTLMQKKKLSFHKSFICSLFIQSKSGLLSQKKTMNFYFDHYTRMSLPQRLKCYHLIKKMSYPTKFLRLEDINVLV